MPANRVTGSGIELTTEEVSRILTQPLQQASSFLASGVKIFDTTGPFRIPASPTFDLSAVNFVGESTAIPLASGAFTDVQLLPSTMKSLKVITKYSNELARASVVALDAVLQSSLVRDTALKLDQVFYAATGGDGTTIPQGMFQWVGTQKLPLTGPLTLDNLLDGQALALGAHVDPNALRLFVRPEQFIELRKLKDTQERYLLQPDAQSQAVASILGMPVTVSSSIPAGRAAIADTSQIAVARDSSPSIKILTERFADTDEQAIRVVSRYDAKPLHPAAVVCYSGITLAGATAAKK